MSGGHVVQFRFHRLHHVQSLSLARPTSRRCGAGGQSQHVALSFIVELDSVPDYSDRPQEGRDERHRVLNLDTHAFVIYILAEQLL